ncbi:hypothetical protein T484DRAFT_1772712 [Baffinella frigidus]|nr:hypothetical protein T484DRAFT_1772712 [Cryptophyta sp. CCMP2293]
MRRWHNRHAIVRDVSLLVVCLIGGLVQCAESNDIGFSEDYFHMIDQPRSGDVVSYLPVFTTMTIIGWGWLELRVDNVPHWSHRFDDPPEEMVAIKTALAPRWDGDPCFQPGKHTFSLLVALPWPMAEKMLAMQVDFSVTAPPERVASNCQVPVASNRKATGLTDFYQKYTLDATGPFTVMLIGDFIHATNPAKSPAGRVANGLEEAGAFVHQVQETELSGDLMVAAIFMTSPDLILYVPWDSTLSFQRR